MGLYFEVLKVVVFGRRQSISDLKCGACSALPLKGLTNWNFGFYFLFFFYFLD